MMYSSTRADSPTISQRRHDGLAGFQSTARAAAPAPVTASRVPTTQTASCPKCRNAWETRPISSSQYVETRTQVMQCEDCTNAVSNFLTEGEFKHACSTCGDQVDQMCMKH